MFSVVILVVFAVTASQATNNNYVITDVKGPARTFNGIGGLSGGGATSVFLPSYPKQQRDEILDYLFKPNFGASLQILKVEIGGDAQSTDGAESSHMHNPWDENYERGYEWWLMVEAKKRNPNIKLYGLAWAYPQWVTCAPGTMTNCTDNIYTYPDVTARYITKWIAGAKNTYGLDIDYVGSWNERPYNTTYLKALRRTLDSNGFPNTKIVAPDSDWSIAGDILKDPELAEAVYGLGAHYPGTTSTPDAVKTDKPLWASEDDSTYNNNIGAGCWARIINQNYVNGNMTASINWNLIAAYMKGTNWYRAGLMSALQPWDGSYGTFNADGSWTVGPMMWATAHTTQFTEPTSWSYLAHGDGAGHLQGGGSYVTLKNFATGDFTIVIEKMSRDRSSCVRPVLPGYTTVAENATFALRGALQQLAGKTLNYWATHWASYDGDQSYEFQKMTPINVAADGTFTINIPIDTIITLTTITTGKKGSFLTPTKPSLFPATYKNDFESCPISKEGTYFADQNGIFECYPSGDAAHNTVLRQMVPLRPVTWGGDIAPHTLIGHRDGKDITLTFDAYIEENLQSVTLGLRMQGTDNSVGNIFAIDTTGAWAVYASISDIGVASKAVKSGTFSPPPRAGTWHTYTGTTIGTTFAVSIDGVSVFNITGKLITNTGHSMLGTMRYGHFTQFDNVAISTVYTTCGNTPLAIGSPVSVVNCGSEVGLQPGSIWRYNGIPNNAQSNATISLRANPSLCLAAKSADASQPWWLVLAVCNPSDPLQQWMWSLDGIAPDSERQSYIYLASSKRCIDVYNQIPDIGAPMDAWPCNFGFNQAFFYDHDAGEIGNEATSTCVGVC
eukprot:PhF_6_TR40219/c0_g1_i1/m.59754/K01202/GALC; galactosylceramidase